MIPKNEVHRMRRFSFPMVGLLPAALAFLFLLPHEASGAVGSSTARVATPQQSQPTAVPAWSSSFEAATVSAAQNDFERGNPNPGVHPPNSNPYGLSYGEWSAKWWQWILQIPAATNPNLDATGANCAEGQSGHVWFLAGSFGTLPPHIVRDCTIPAGKSLLVPVLNQADGAALLDCAGPAPFDVPCADFTFGGKTGLDALREEASVSMNDPALLEVSLDGVPLSKLTSYRVQSPVFSFSLTTGNIISFLLTAFGFPGSQPPGIYTPAVSDGYWVMFTPLPPGHHTIHFEGATAGGFAPGGTTYNITVRD
jgi:hypothetical protein